MLLIKALGLVRCFGSIKIIIRKKLSAIGLAASDSLAFSADRQFPRHVAMAKLSQPCRLGTYLLAAPGLDGQSCKTLA